MLKPDSNIVRIEGEAKLAKLSPAQKKFNSLIKKIEQQKQLLAAWQETIPYLQKQSAEKLEPLLKTYSGHRAELAQLLDEQYAVKGFTAKQREKMAHLILDICADLINQHGMEELKPLYNKYSDADFDTESQEIGDLSNDVMKSILKDGLGIDMDDEEIDLENPERMAERLRERIEAQRQQHEERRGKRKKTAKQLKKEAELKAAEEDAGKAIRAVYRQLTTALHPDREQDPEEHKRKTELMQRVTVAYKKKDLLQLLELQLAVEQIDQAHINNIAEDRLKHFNRVLQGQLDQLQDEVQEVEMTLKMNLQLMPFEQLTPQRAISGFKRDLDGLRLEINQIKHDLNRFKDVKHLKAWLKNYRMDRGMDDFDDFLGDLRF